MSLAFQIIILIIITITIIYTSVYLPAYAVCTIYYDGYVKADFTGITCYGVK